jgi:membrane protease YdiL (CAAX protease family)
MVLFILFGTILRNDNAVSSDLEQLFKIFVWIMCGLILIRFIGEKIQLNRLSKNTVVWTLIGLVGGIFVAIIGAYSVIHTPGFQSETFFDPSQNPPFMTLLISLLGYYGTAAAVPEEFIFRGLLWGYLTRLWGDNNKACLAQGLIFWLFHYDRIIASPVFFWIISPIYITLFSLLVLRSRSLAPSIVAHTTVNTLHIVFIIIMTSS